MKFFVCALLVRGLRVFGGVLLLLYSALPVNLLKRFQNRGGSTKPNNTVLMAIK